MSVDVAQSEMACELAALAVDVVLIADLHVLFIMRDGDPFAGQWALPGGGVEPGEKALAAAIRELREETDVAASDLRFTGVYGGDDPGRDPRGRVVSFAYGAHLAQMPTPRAGSDARKAAWHPLDLVRSGGLPLAFDHGVIVRDALRILEAG